MSRNYNTRLKQVNWDAFKLGSHGSNRADRTFDLEKQREILKAQDTPVRRKTRYKLTHDERVDMYATLWPDDAPKPAPKKRVVMCAAKPKRKRAPVTPADAPKGRPILAASGYRGNDRLRRMIGA